jgi:phosphatidylethanolamine/phosphatidyl-N-methylethanolamine N-methyltransferase
VILPIKPIFRYLSMRQLVRGFPISTTTRSTRWTAFGPERSALGLFVRRWLADPVGIGGVLPSAPSLAFAMARQVRFSVGENVIELGPGTGAVTRALIAMGVPESRLILVERDREMHAFLCERFPEARVIEGDAAALDRILPHGQHDRPSSIISSLPLVSMPHEQRNDILRAAFAVLAGDGRFVQYTYGPSSPVNAPALGLHARKVEQVWLNLPPASGWSYTRAA